MPKYDVIVVGAGSMGMSAGFQLAKDKNKVLMIDALDPPHNFGSHGGHTRLIRHALGEGLHYVPLALRSQKIMNAIHEIGDEDSFLETGVLTFGKSDSEVVNTAIKAAKEYMLNSEIFFGGERMNERWEGLNLPDNYIGIYEPHGGVIDANTTINFFKNKALKLDAELITNTPVEKIEIIHDKLVRIHTADQSYTAEKVILTVGAHTNQLLKPLDLQLNLQTTRRTVTWFETNEEQYASENFPGFIGKVDDGYDCYGFPSIDGSGVKIGSYDFGQDDDVEHINFEYGAYDEDEEVVRYFLDKYMPTAAGTEIRGEVCLFQNTPDHDFIIDFHPQHDNLLIAAGFSGHGFKFVPAIGEILSQLTQKGETEFDIEKFAIQREGIIVDA